MGRRDSDAEAEEAKSRQSEGRGSEEGRRSQTGGSQEGCKEEVRTKEGCARVVANELAQCPGRESIDGHSQNSLTVRSKWVKVESPVRRRLPVLWASGTRWVDRVF